ncbi:hypothetical protein J7E35_11475 [Bacillus sp. ISL-45]|nr:hypothetical protein [Bacillus sp. ISL-45]
MKIAAFLLAGSLVLTSCAAYEDTNSNHSMKKISETSVQKNKSKYGELTHEDKHNNLGFALMMQPINPAPEFSILEIYNKGSLTFLADSELTVEKFIDGAWYEVLIPREASFEGETEFIGPGGGYHQKIENNMLKEMISEEGKYRLIKVLKAKEKGQKDVVLAHTINVGTEN